MKQGFFIWLIVLSLGANAQSADTVVLRDFTHVWMAMDSNGNRSPQLTEETKLVVFTLPPDEQGQLLVEASAPVDIWINNQLVYAAFDSSAVIQPGGQSIELRVFCDKGVRGNFSAKLVTLALGRSDYMVSPKNEGAHPAYVIIWPLLLLVAGIFRHFFPVTYGQSLRNPLSLKVRSVSVDQNYVNFGSIDNMFSVGFFGLLMALALDYTGQGSTIFQVARAGLASSLWSWLWLGLIVSALVLAKYLYVSLLARLFQFREIPNIQTQDFVHFFTLIAVVCVMLSMSDFSFGNFQSGVMQSVSIGLLVVAAIFFPFWIYLKLDKFYSNRKLVIISYLCTTEFLPAFISIFWLLN